jgi:hypothetical protein
MLEGEVVEEEVLEVQEDQEVEEQVEDLLGLLEQLTLEVVVVELELYLVLKE